MPDSVVDRRSLTTEWRGHRCSLLGTTNTKQLLPGSYSKHNMCYIRLTKLINQIVRPVTNHNYVNSLQMSVIWYNFKLQVWVIRNLNLDYQSNQQLAMVWRIRGPHSKTLQYYAYRTRHTYFCSTGTNCRVVFSKRSPLDHLVLRFYPGWVPDSVAIVNNN